MWLLHPKFPRMVQSAWDQFQPLNTAISSFTQKVNKWNMEVFGNLFARKRRVLARLNGAQKALAYNPKEFLIQFEKQLIEKYSLIMLQEEELWAIKSWLNWAAFGDCNTSFFHVSTVVRRHRNRIKCFKDAMGE